MQLNEVNWLRFVAISSIVILHCFVCPNAFWGLLEPSVYTNSIRCGSSIVMPEANMPLFVALSGYLFAHSFYSQKSSYKSFIGILKNKFHRLVVPFIILGSIATLCVPERPFFSGMYWGDGSSLWFCIMLFWCTMIRSAVLFSDNKWLKSIVLGISIVTILIYQSNYECPRIMLGIPIGMLCFSRAVYFYFYFVLGEILYNNRVRWIKFRWPQYTLLIIIYAVTTIIIGIEKEYVSFLKGFLAIPYILILFAGFTQLVNKKVLIGGGKIEQFCKYSFGIYVLHEPISWNCYHNKYLLEIFRSTPFFYSVMFTVIVFVICYITTHFCLKTKIGKYLLS